MFAFIWCRFNVPAYPPFKIHFSVMAIIVFLLSHPLFSLFLSPGGERQVLLVREAQQHPEI